MQMTINNGVIAVPGVINLAMRWNSISNLEWEYTWWSTPAAPQRTYSNSYDRWYWDNWVSWYKPNPSAALMPLQRPALYYLHTL